mgnify:CR=1 FL=1
MLKNIKLTASLIFGFAVIFAASGMIVYSLVEAYKVDRLAIHLCYALAIGICLFTILQAIGYVRGAVLRFTGKQKHTIRNPLLIGQMLFGATLTLTSSTMGVLAIRQVVASVDDVFYVAAYTVVTIMFGFSGCIGLNLISYACRSLSEIRAD